MAAVDDDGHTLLANAASSGGKGIFDTVLAAVKEEIGQREVRHTLSCTE